METYLKWILIIAGSVVLLALLVIGYFFLLRKKKKKEAEEFPEILETLGGKENITSLSYKGSRVSIVVNVKKNVDKKRLKDFEEVETVVISGKKVTLVTSQKLSKLIHDYLMSQM